MSVLQHPLLCRPLVTTVRYCQSNDEVKEAKERLEGERGYKPIEVDWQTSIEYMDSKGNELANYSRKLVKGYLIILGQSIKTYVVGGVY